MVSNKWIWDLMRDSELPRKTCHYCGGGISESDRNFPSTLACNECFEEKFTKKQVEKEKESKVRVRRTKKAKTEAL